MTSKLFQVAIKAIHGFDCPSAGQKRGFARPPGRLRARRAIHGPHFAPLLCLTALCLALLAAPPAAPAQDALQANKDLVRGFFRAMITNDQQALPRFFAQGYQVVEIGLPDGPAPPLKSHISPDFRVRAVHLHQALTNLSLSITSLVAEGGQVMAQVTLTGTHRGEFLGVVATGRRLSLHAMVIFEIENGRITKTTELLDMLGTMRQLGYIKLD